MFTATAKEAETVLEKLEKYSMYALLATEYMEHEQLKDVKRQWNTPHAVDSMPVLGIHRYESVQFVLVEGYT